MTHLLAVFFLAAFVLVMASAARAVDEGAQGYVSGEQATPAVYQAATLVNEGLGLMRANHNQEAVDKLSQAVRMAPDLPEAHHNLGLALAKVGNFSEAVYQLNEALKLKPGLWSTWLTLGGLYQSTGALEEAIGTYKEFLKRFPTHSEAPKVASLLKGLANERRSVGKQPGAEGDYVSAVTRDGVFRWSAKRMPLRVFVRAGDDVPGYRPSFGQILLNCFNDWAEASKGLVKFVFVSEAHQCDIDCSWTDDSRKLANPSEAGESKVFTDYQGITRGTIVLLTVPLAQELPLTDNRMQVNCLHEIGHVLGLAGHTRDPEDIMFYSASLQDQKRALSERDSNTLVRIYSQN